MGFLAVIDGLLTGQPITFFEHERHIVPTAKSLVEQAGIRTSLTDKVETPEWGTCYVFSVSNYDKAVQILREAGIM